MARLSRLSASVTGVFSLICLTPLYGAFDQGAINEVFSNADGDIQYIELLTATDVEQNLQNQPIISRDTNGEIFSSINLPSDFVVDASAFTFLLATQKFVDETGLEADYILPENFLPTDGGTIDLASGVAMFTYLPGQLPLNGIQSVGSSGTPQIATPRNSAGLDAFVSLPINAQFDTANGTLNLPVLSVPGLGVANVTFSANLEALNFTLQNDFFLYQTGVEAGDAPAVLREDNSLLVPRLPIASDVFEFELSVVQAEPLVFGNLNILSVTNESSPVVPTPEPEPEPTPDPLQASIAQGQIFYSQQCSGCHGVDGSGVSAPSLLNSTNFDALRSRIDFTMPLGNSGSCTDNQSNSCATDTANYIINVLQQ